MERVKTAVLKDPYTPEQMRKLGEEAIRQITVRTRLGYGVDKVGAPRKRLKPLSEGYIEMRRKSKVLSEFTNSRRSNLTHTGQMLESLKLRITRFGVFIEPTGARSDGISNMDVAASVTRYGRAFLSFTDLELKKLKRFLEKDILGKTLRKRGLTR